MKSIDLSKQSIAELLRSLARESGGVDLEIEGSIGTSRLSMARGRVVDAECAGVRGITAVEMVLLLREGIARVVTTKEPRSGSFDLGLEEALGAAQGSSGYERRQPSPVGGGKTLSSARSAGIEAAHQVLAPGPVRHDQTISGSFMKTSSRPPKTLAGFPEKAPVGRDKVSSGGAGGFPAPRRAKVLSDPPPEVAPTSSPPARHDFGSTLVGPSGPPRHLQGPSGGRPRQTGYSSAPPPALAEERLGSASRPGISAGRSSLADLARAVAPTPPPATEPARNRKLDSTGIRPVQRRALESTKPNVSQVSSALDDAEDTGPISSLHLDKESLSKLEVLHDGISSTTHELPDLGGDRSASPSVGKVEILKPASSRPAAPQSAATAADGVTSTVATESPAADESGEARLPRVGRYEVLARLKSGGMGSVYLCRLSGSAGFRRLFAMKVLHADLVTNREVLGLFFQEANLLSHLHHPNIVGIVDVGSVEQPYLVLDYVEGGSLAELLRADAEGTNPAAISAIMLDALNGLSAVHRLVGIDGKLLGLVHNDISPHNLLIGIDGTCRITDFGIAHAREAAHGKAPSRGKPSYTAPERILGHSVDSRADLFSLGVVFYTALTGVDPFAGDTQEETLRNVLQRDVPPPSQVGRRPPPALDWFCLKALARAPGERFRDAEDMAVELRRILMQADLLAAPSLVANWVKEALEGTLEARREAATRGLDAVERRRRVSTVPQGGGLLRPGLLGLSDDEQPPPSSRDFNDRTEILDGRAALARGEQLSGRGRNVLFAACGALILLAIGSVFVFPRALGGLVSRQGEAVPLTAEEAFEVQKSSARFEPGSRVVEGPPSEEDAPGPTSPAGTTGEGSDSEKAGVPPQDAASQEGRATNQGLSGPKDEGVYVPPIPHGSSK